MIHIKDLTFSYTGSPPYLLYKINLNIEKGAYVSIIGENGSAKTTLIKLILGLLHPLKGTIHVSTKKIGYVPQMMETFNSQFPITVSELIKCHMKILKIKDKASVDRCLNIMGMSKFKNSLIGNLSGGQRQKIFIARALIGHPDLLIFDEPSTGIDIPSQKDIYKLISNLNRNSSITILSVEHNLKAALENSSQICTIDSGNISLYNIEEYKRLTALKN
ncbi:metal ABC transporter ATP-binding protein [Clostridium sp. WLY-B-L2]|jgi:zinc transport system ATP-binding protein|uniref:Metal ABC transporter ATP-binding protein n=1 Tax=Clostridium aromativorans TaxID=2836848 RepID=A0ABS8NAL9_9CLOT|nr:MULTISPECIES: metal ABC transporter ATP-binding protein [Clostridium]KAA8671539.1 metal ABC transporter ATP-binding protein [Clostridium sp. HV4-5-A1G]MCC9296858.1 metal ABC transporter ATP-binding protein [Clostridium aromativorans]CAB1250832.1 putative metal transport system ATP-binding protein TP_0035 [Clostridiaceae bacterium BL-3]